MGQNVNYLLGNSQTMLGADPELYRQQLVQAEQSRIQALPPQQALAAQLGNLFGRGLGNVATGQNFFEVTNPVLQKLTSIQGIYNQAMQAADPNDPLSFYKELQTRFADAGLGQQSMMAAQELRRVQAEATKAKGDELKNLALETEVYKANPRLLDEQIAKARSAGNDELANRLAEQRGQIQVDIDTKRKKDLLSIELTLAQTDTEKARVRELNARADAGKLDKTVIPDNQGGGTIVYTDSKTGKQVERVVVTSDLLSQIGANKPGAKPSGEKPSAATFDKRNTPAAAPATPAATAAPAPAPMAAAPATPYDQNTGTYRIALDPVYQQIQADAQANIQRLQTDPTYQAEINRRILDLQNRIRSNFGNMVVIQ
jgi:hypothetical protein